MDLSYGPGDNISHYLYTVLSMAVNESDTGTRYPTWWKIMIYVCLAIYNSAKYLMAALLRFFGRLAARYHQQASKPKPTCSLGKMKLVSNAFATPIFYLL